MAEENKGEREEIDDPEFVQFITEKIIGIEKKLVELDERLKSIEGDWRLIKKAVWVILSIVLAKLGVDVSGIMGGG